MTLMRELAPYASGMLAGIGILLALLSHIVLAAELEGWPEKRPSPAVLSRSQGRGLVAVVLLVLSLVIERYIGLGTTPVLITVIATVIAVLNVIGHWVVIRIEDDLKDAPDRRE